jgi:Zinc knuckle
VTSPVLSGCFHCEEYGHRIADCPLLITPAGKAEHEQRFATVMERFFAGQITPHGKRRVIAEENRMWAQVQKEKVKAK